MLAHPVIHSGADPQTELGEQEGLSSDQDEDGREWQSQQSKAQPDRQLVDADAEAQRHGRPSMYPSEFRDPETGEILPQPGYPSSTVAPDTIRFTFEKRGTSTPPVVDLFCRIEFQPGVLLEHRAGVLRGRRQGELDGPNVERV